MSALLATTMLVIVTQNQVALKAAPRENAPQQAVLRKGEVLELRGARGDYLRVYDLKREREGYLHTVQVHTTALTPEEAPELLAVMRFLRDSPGEEALGISYAAAYLKAVPAGALTAEPLDAIGAMAERLAERASIPQPKSVETTIAGQLEVVAELGVTMKSIDQGGGVQLCYEGEAYRRLLAMPVANSDQQVRAALGLTRHECVDPTVGPTDRYQYDLWRAQILDDVSLEGLDPVLRDRLLMRRAGVLSAIAFWQSRRGLDPRAAAERAIADLAGVDKSQLDEHGLTEYADAAVRVGASRVAAQGAVSAPGTTTGHGGKLIVRTTAGSPGETCVSLYDANRPGDALVRRCTFGTVWTVSATGNPDGTALTLAVQPLPAWRELWVFHQGAGGWTVTVLPPDSDASAPGYIEAAGWEPNCKRLLIVRESHLNTHLHRRFEVLRLDTLGAVQQAGSPELLASFMRWEDPVWQSNTVALR
jgi:hypothetical protein